MGDAYLGAVSRFMTNAFEYGDALLPVEDVGGGEAEAFSPKKPYLNLATSVQLSFLCTYPTDIYPYRFRMVVLADEILESFFDADLSASFQLEPVPVPESMQPPKSGFFGGLVSSIMSNENNKQMFNSFSDSIGRTMGRHQVRFFLFVVPPLNAAMH